MIASLPMYDVAELRDATDTLWGAIRDAIRKRGGDAPETLDRLSNNRDVWTSKDLVLSQTCGMPWRLGLHRHAQLVGTPDYGVEGCPPGYYCSVIVVRESDSRAYLGEYASAVCAYNSHDSQSGFAAWEGTEFDAMQQTGAHADSIVAIANGNADIAAIDAVTWRIAKRYQSEAAELRVLGLTKPTPGLPFITSPTADAELIYNATADAITNLDPTIRRALGLVGLVKIPNTKYLAIPGV